MQQWEETHPVTRNLVKLQLRSRLGHQLLLLLLLLLQAKKSTGAYVLQPNVEWDWKWVHLLQQQPRARLAGCLPDAH